MTLEETTGEEFQRTCQVRGKRTDNEMAYQGFDPKVVANKLKSLCGQNDFLKDMSCLIVVAIDKGPKVEKIKRSLAPEAVKRFTELVVRYNIRSTGSPLNRTDITLPRIMNCFPLIAVKYADKKSSTLVIDHASVCLRYNIQFPKGMIVGCFPSCIPEDERFDRVASLHSLIQVMVGQVISNKSETNQERYDKAARIGSAARYNDYVERIVRDTLMEEMRIVSGGVIDKNILQAEEVLRQALLH